MKKNSIFLISFALFFNCSSSPEAVSPKVLGNKNKYNAAAGRYLPKKYRTPKPEVLSYKIDGGTLKLYTAGFKQGNAVLAEIIDNPKSKTPLEKVKLVFASADVPLSRKSWGSRGIFGLNPETRAGARKLMLTYEFKGEKKIFKNDINIRDANFPVSKVSLDLGRFSNVEYKEDPGLAERIKDAAAKKKKAFSTQSDDMLGRILAHPRDFHRITSPFWAKRQYMRYRIKDGKKIRYPDQISIHRGLDMRAVTGADVYSVARGRVILAEKLHYEGNMVIVDHGNKVFSYYMHLNELKVKEGEMVEAGKLIALAGSTGISTGAHLHVSVVIRGIQVDPMSILALPIRD